MAASMLHQRSIGQVASTSSRTQAVRPCIRANSRCVRVRSTAPGFEKAIMGEDFGARDPTAGELASNFSEKVLGNFDTQHIIKPPDAIGKHIGLGARQCQPVDSLSVLDEITRERLRNQVPGWRVQNNSQGVQSIRQDWNVKDAAAAQELIGRMRAITEEQGHAATNLDAVSTTVIVELTTPALGGLTENDFIVAAKINALDVSDVIAKRKPRFWA